MGRTFSFLIILILLQGCTKPRARVYSAQDSLHVIKDILNHREEADTFFRHDPDSPFNRDTSIRYEGIKWYPPDVHFCIESRLYRYDRPERVIILGTKGEERPMAKYGYFVIPLEGRDYRLNVYKSAESGQNLSVWFTDGTTAKETYPVGRYLDVGEEEADPEHLYVINFNNAYNPYCAYSALYSCAVPRREDHVDAPIRAGEMNYRH